MNFGTDGIRGKADAEMAACAVKLGNALGQGGKIIYIGRDTRESGVTLLNCLTAGIIMAGGKAVDIGIIPTAGVAYAVAQSDADYGVVISASHNPEEYNGLKVFDGNGYKLGDRREQEISNAMSGELKGDYSGIASKDIGSVNKYIEHLCGAGVDLGGMKILLDCANGAAYDIAPKVFKALGAEVYTVGVDAEGKINDNCGSTCAKTLKERAKGIEWDIAFAFDGDSDRLIAVDEQGDIIDGDRIIYYIAKRWADEGKLNPMRAVGTVLSNTGTQKAFEDIGITFDRSDVGDKYVLEKMIESSAIIGGEQSGHIILTPYATTGDGILSAVVFASLLKRQNDEINKWQNDNGKRIIMQDNSGIAMQNYDSNLVQRSKVKDGQTYIASGEERCGKTQKSDIGGLTVKASEAGRYELYPQTSGDIIVSDKASIIGSAEIAQTKEAWREKLDGGRVLVRASGTEPKIRVMAECKSIDVAKACVEDIINICKKMNN